MREPQPVNIRTAVSLADREAALEVRRIVFIEEQRVPAEVERDSYDSSALHLLAWDTGSDTVIGTARVLDRGDGIAKIGRVAVLREWRGRGIGQALMAAALSEAQAAGFTRAVLDSQSHALPFYERLGFTAEGEEFEEAGIPHRHMTKCLPPTPSPD